MHIPNDSDKGVAVNADITSAGGDAVEKAEFELDSFSPVILMQTSAFIPKDVVTPDMTAEQIQACVDKFDRITFEPGKYDNASITMKNTHTIVLSEGDYSGIGFRIQGRLTVEYSGTITIDGGGIKTSDYGNTAFNLQSGELNFYGKAASDVLTIQECGVGIFIETSENKVINIKTGRIHITSSTSKAGIFAVGSGNCDINIQGEGISRSENTRVTGAAGNESLYTTALYSCNNVGGGIYDCSSGNMRINVNQAYVSLSGNGFSGFYSGDQPPTSNGNIFTITDSCFVSSNNKGTGVAYSSSKSGDERFNVVRSYVEILNNVSGGGRSQGINGGFHNYKDSTVNVAGSRSSNIQALQIIAYNSEVSANDAKSEAGIWLYDYNSASEFTDCDINADNNSAYGIFAYGPLTLKNTKAAVKNNGNTGIYLYNGNDIQKSSRISDGSIVVTSGNGRLAGDSTKVSVSSGILLITGILKVENSVLDVREATKYGVSFASISGCLGTEGFPVTYEIGANTVAAIDAAQLAAADLHNPDAVSASDRILVSGGSLQMVRTDASGSAEYTVMNDVKGAYAVYAAPVSANGTMLNRFDLNKEINKEATGGTNILTLYDPNKNNEAYSYSFRYNSASEDLNGNGDNAYIWAAVTVLNYDATQGRINSLGTAQAGNVRLSNTRGDGTELKNPLLDESDGSYIDATDYTVYNNSLQLSEGILASAVRDGYTFDGWYYVNDRDTAKAAEAAAKGDWGTLYGLLAGKFDGATRDYLTLTGAENVEQITIYAKWTPAGPTVPEPTPGGTADTPTGTATIASVLGVSAAPTVGVLGEAAPPAIGVLGDAKGPGTGDTALVAFWIAVLAGAAAILAGYGVYKKKKPSENRKTKKNGK